jgi:hypothetical protein
MARRRVTRLRVNKIIIFLMRILILILGLRPRRKREVHPRKRTKVSLLTKQVSQLCIKLQSKTTKKAQSSSLSILKSVHSQK